MYTQKEKIQKFYPLPSHGSSISSSLVCSSFGNLGRARAQLSWVRNPGSCAQKLYVRVYYLTYYQLNTVTIQYSR